MDVVSKNSNIDKTRILVIFTTMTATSPNARALAALGHDARLSIFRLLVKAGDDGLRVSDIGEHLGFAPSTLAHHLSTLVDAGLVLQEKQGREVFNRVDYPAMRRVVGFLTSECCAGVAIHASEDAA
jgi:ArsR family transcriptional regulator